MNSRLALAPIKKIVLVFDICSSTAILDDLIQSENQQQWNLLLRKLKEHMRPLRVADRIDVYKFLGDGWIVLFSTDIRPDAIVNFIQEVCDEFGKLYRALVHPLLSHRPATIGVKFGLDIGSLVRIKMYQKVEWIGRPLNVASRLQGAIENGDDDPASKVLMTPSVFQKLRSALGDRKYREVTRSLRNLANGQECRCFKVTFHPRRRLVGRRAVRLKP